MNRICEDVRKFWKESMRGYTFDPEVLQLCIDTLDPSELKLLFAGESNCQRTPTKYESYKYLMRRIRNRHNDISMGFTTVEGDKLVLTPRSSLSELSIAPSTQEECAVYGIRAIEDFSLSNCSMLSLETVADVTAGLLQFRLEQGSTHVISD